MQWRCDLYEIEIHVAWLYSTALELANARAGHRGDSLVKRMLLEAEAFRCAVADLESQNIDADLALDVAAVLDRALCVWRANVDRWRGNAQDAAVMAAAAEVTKAADRLQEWLVSRPWVAEDPVAFMTPLSTTVQ